MEQYAFIDNNNIVIQVIERPIENGDLDWEAHYSESFGATCKRVNIKIHKNYAGMGFTYDPIDDAFIAPMPNCEHESLLLNNNKRWECSECDSMIPAKPQCGHESLFLNNKFWECSECEALYNEAHSL